MRRKRKRPAAESSEPGSARAPRARRSALPPAVCTLNACLLPSHLRWIFRAHRLFESLESAARRVARAIIAHHRSSPFEAIHLQEIFTEAGFAVLRSELRAVGLVHSSGFARCGLCSFATSPITLLRLSEAASLTDGRPKAWIAMQIGAVVHVNLHFASEIDGKHAGRLAQARELGAWIQRVREGREPLAATAQGGGGSGTRQAGQRAVAPAILVIGDTNEPDEPGRRHALLAAAVGATPRDALPASYSLLRGAVRGRLDRGYLFAASGAGAAGAAGAGTAGAELVGRVCTDLPDVSDHFLVRFDLQDEVRWKLRSKCNVM